MKKITTMLLVILFISFSIASVNAANIDYSPTSEFFVNDFAGVLSDTTEQEILNIGRTIEQKTTAQLVVVTVPNMNGDYIESYANKLFNKWGIGAKDKNNGVLLIISKEDRKIRIEVGYGLEGAINDAKAGRILDKYAITSLKEDNYDAAVQAVVTQVQGEIYNEYGIDNTIENPNYLPEESYKIDTKYILIGIAIFIFLVIITKGKILEVLLWIIMLSGRRRLFWWRKFRRTEVLLEEEALQEVFKIKFIKNTYFKMGIFLL